MEHLIQRAQELGAHRRFWEEMIPALWQAAIEYELDPAGMVGQSAKETAHGRFTGVLGPERHNTTGLKRREGGGNYDPDAHATFDNWLHGARAHASHLRAYMAPRVPMTENDYSPRSVWVLPHEHGFTRYRQLSTWFAPAENYGSTLESLTQRYISTN